MQSGVLQILCLIPLSQKSLPEPGACILTRLETSKPHISRPLRFGTTDICGDAQLV